MSLGRRLVLTAVFLLVVFGVTAAVVTRTQGNFLVAQLDQQLGRIAPLAATGPPPPTPTVSGEDFFSADVVSNIYIGLVGDDGTITDLLRGDRIGAVPTLDSTRAKLDVSAIGAPFNVASADGTSRFRALLVPTPDGPGSILVAISRDDVDASLYRLNVTLGLGLLALCVSLLVAGVWMRQMGIRPLTRLTGVAEAITAGDRSHRASVMDPRTEAGKLAEALNAMLDERDASELRLRQFIADASHELRTPLTSIRGYLDLYARGELNDPESLDDAVRRLTQESARMNDLVEDLLLLAKLDQQRPLLQEDVDIGQILRDAALDARALQPDRHTELDVADNLWVIGDPARLRQAVGVLVSNVLAHTERSAGLTIEGREAEAGVVIAVCDDGPGLSVSDATSAFDRFYRGDASRDRRSGGSGLGLAISKGIAEAHGGEIALHTAVGAGSRFEIVLPAHRSGA